MYIGISTYNDKNVKNRERKKRMNNHNILESVRNRDDRIKSAYRTVPDRIPPWYLLFTTYVIHILFIFTQPTRIGVLAYKILYTIKLTMRVPISNVHKCIIYYIMLVRIRCCKSFHTCIAFAVGQPENKGWYIIIHNYYYEMWHPPLLIIIVLCFTFIHVKNLLNNVFCRLTLL